MRQQRKCSTVPHKNTAWRCRISYRALTIAAFEASAADASFPPDLTPSNADTDHSDDAEF